MRFVCSGYQPVALLGLAPSAYVWLKQHGFKLPLGEEAVILSALTAAGRWYLLCAVNGCTHTNGVVALLWAFKAQGILTDMYVEVCVIFASNLSIHERLLNEWCGM